MPKKADEPLQKHTLNLYAGDFTILCELYPDIKPSMLVRELVRSCIKRTQGNTTSTPDISGPEIGL